MRGHIARLVAAVSIVLAGISMSHLVLAQDAAGCEGLSAYRDSIISVRTAHLDALAEDDILPDRATMTYSTAEWQALASNAADYQLALKAIEPPVWAADWHQSQIAVAGLHEQMGLTASTVGIVALKDFEETTTALEASIEEAEQTATQSCPAFLVFEAEWDSLGGVLVGDSATASPDEDGQASGEIATYDYECCQHSDGPVDYSESPPVGGVHHIVWQNCGFYDAPVRNEHAVHSLEHGAVWITYLTPLPAEQIEQLRTLAATDDYPLVSPYEDQESPIVATAWNNQLEIASADAPVLAEFVQEFLQGPQTPEFGAPCSGGTSETIA